MPYIPHTKEDTKKMLDAIGIKSIDDLFAEIPKDLRIDGLKNIPKGLNELDISKLLKERAAKDHAGLCFIGAGAYEHYIPAVVSDLTSRGEFLTAYTPYQAEASQGTLQVIYEYQSMICNLMQMETSNASMYDGASALSEAILMALRLHKNKQAKTILLPQALHPTYRKVIKTITKPHHLELVTIPYDPKTGTITLDTLKAYTNNNVAAIVIAQPNFFGALEDVDAITDWAHQNSILVIGNLNPIAAALLKPPGSWGESGADIAAGDGQPLGAPLANGGPYFGYMCAKKENIRQLPGRIVGRTTDKDGKTGFVLTLQAREQHIRRGKATSNICSNQALMATGATIYMSLLGAEGLRRVAAASNANANLLRKRLLKIEGISAVFNNTFFHEFVIKLQKPVGEVLSNLANKGVQGGFDLSIDYPKLGNSLLICTTETKSEDDLEFYARQLEEIL
ncbi:MAG: aminomethyl-transferring glycine dehydrogenase subunit GcvPA [Gammaproteobacteria bacterium]|nr:aminomethyl-transferring glycine dehydrogenase subunit GcvPA [Gammaproteobacteria bacterium]